MIARNAMGTNNEENLQELVCWILLPWKTVQHRLFAGFGPNQHHGHLSRTLNRNMDICAGDDEVSRSDYHAVNCYLMHCAIQIWWGSPSECSGTRACYSPKTLRWMAGYYESECQDARTEITYLRKRYKVRALN